jgi:hypothetical protein
VRLRPLHHALILSGIVGLATATAVVAWARHHSATPALACLSMTPATVTMSSNGELPLNTNVVTIDDEAIVLRDVLWTRAPAEYAYVRIDRPDTLVVGTTNVAHMRSILAGQSRYENVRIEQTTKSRSTLEGIAGCLQTSIPAAATNNPDVFVDYDENNGVIRISFRDNDNGRRTVQSSMITDLVNAANGIIVVTALPPSPFSNERAPTGPRRR